MANSTLTRMHLSEAVFSEVGLSRYESSQLVEAVLAHISDALIRDETVKISSFGTFSTRNKRQLERDEVRKVEQPDVNRKW